MKKRSQLYLFMIVIVISLMIVSGCASDTAAPAEPGTDEPAAPAVTRINMGSGWVTGAYYPLAGGMSRVIHNHSDSISLTVESSGASAVNSRMIGSGDLDMAIVQNDVAFSA